MKKYINKYSTLFIIQVCCFVGFCTVAAAVNKVENGDEFGLSWEYITPPVKSDSIKKEEEKVRSPSPLDTVPKEKGSSEKNESLDKGAALPSVSNPDDRKEASKKPVYVKLDFMNVPLEDLVKSYSQITGENFVYTELEGEAQIVTSGKMTLEEAKELLEIALGLGGYTVLWSNLTGMPFNKIIRKEEAVFDGDVPVIGDEDFEGEETAK